MRWLRYYLLYFMTPIVAYGAVVAFGPGLNPGNDAFVNAHIAAVTTLFWWVLAIITEENMRGIDLYEGATNGY